HTESQLYGHGRENREARRQRKGMLSAGGKCASLESGPVAIPGWRVPVSQQGNGHLFPENRTDKCSMVVFGEGAAPLATAGDERDSDLVRQSESLFGRFLVAREILNPLHCEQVSPQV